MEPILDFMKAMLNSILARTMTKVSSFLKQCFAQSSLDTIWGYFLLIFKLNSADIS